MKFASVLITAFNRPEFLQASIESLRACTYYPYELIIHDDGSEPATKDFLLDLLKRGWISTLVMNPPKHNRGQALAADRCYQVAQGDYVVKMEGDEQYTPGWLTKAVKAMEVFPEIAMLSLQQFCHIHDRYTLQEHVSYPSWDKLELAAFEREGAKISVVWCSPGGQFMTRMEAYHRHGPWWRGHPDQETIEFRARVCPMFRLLAHSRSTRLPAVVGEAALKAHWEKYKNSAWLAVIDPPVVSSHWGNGKGSLPEARPTVQRDPKLLGNEGPPPPFTQQRDRAFGSMTGYNYGRDLDRFGWVKTPHPMRAEWNSRPRTKRKRRK